MFKNLIVYRIGPDWQATPEQIEEALSKSIFIECGATQPMSIGWSAPRGLPHAPLVETVDGHHILKLTVEQKVLPSSVVKKRVDEMASRVEQETGRKPGKKIQKELKDQATLELLPMAFTKQATIRVWIAPQEQLLMIDASSPSRAEEVVTLLVQSLDGLALHLIQTAESPAVCMTAWLMDGVPPAGFTIDRDCELKSGDEMKSVVRYARHALDIEEVRQHLVGGKAPTKLALTWKDRVSLLLTDTLQIKKITFLDVIFEGRDKPEKDEAFDADAAIATGELRQLIPELIDALGGEHDFLGSAPVSLPAAATAALAESEKVFETAPWD